MNPMTSYRLKRLFRNTCDIYQRSAVAPVATGSIEAQDPTYATTRYATAIRCYYEPTPTYTVPGEAGRTQEDNLMTADRWHFDSQQILRDGMLIVMTGPATDTNGNPNPYLNLVWVVEGPSDMNSGLAGRPTNSQWAYARLDPEITIPSQE